MKPAEPPSDENRTPSRPNPSNPTAARFAETISPTTESVRATMSSEMATRPPSQRASGSWTQPEQLPATFGRYELVRLLGQGAMGSVYLAHDSQLDRHVALKIPQFKADDDPSLMKRFFREARAAATLHHANICPVHDVGEINGTQYLTMAHIEGQPLTELIRNTKAIAPRHAASLVRKLALALDEAHRKQVIHRDLKPGNIMLNQRGEPVIMDFGLARRGRPETTRLTQYGSVMGTPAYMAPEQARGVPEDMGPACDIYSLGVILYELLAGRPPFEGDVMAVLSQLLMDEPEPPSAYRADLDRKLEAICLKAMAKRPDARYRSMGELARALTEYLKATSQPVPTGTPQTQPVPDLPRSREPSVGRVSESPDRVSGDELPQDFYLGSDEAVLPRKTHYAHRSNGRLSPRLWIAIAAGAAALVLAGIVILVRTKNGTIQIELSDSSAKVEVTVDGDTIDIAGLSQPLRLKPGEHNILVQGRDFETYSESFTVKEGDNPVMRVTLIPGPKVTAAGPVPLAANPPELSPAKLVETPPQEPTNPDRRGEWISLGNGRDLNGWKGNFSYWKVQEGVIVGKLPQQQMASYTYLCTEKKYRDFELRLKAKLLEGNSGVQVRSSISNAESFDVAGPQIEIVRPPQLWGTVITSPTNDPSRRASADEVSKNLKPDDYNELLIRCVGKHITVQLNGTTVNDADFPSMPDEGIIALQLHKRFPGMEVQFKDIEIKILNEAGTAASTTTQAPAASNSPAKPTGGKAVETAPGRSANSAFKAGQVWEGSYQPGRNQDLPFRLRIIKVDARKFVADFYFLQFAVEGHGSEMAGEFQDSERFTATFTRRIRGTWIEQFLKDAKLDGEVTKDGLTGIWIIPSNNSKRHFTGRLAKSEEKLPASVAPSTRVPDLNDQTFAKWRDYIAPKDDELTWLKIPWQATFWDAVVEAQKIDKPIVIWAMTGDPLGCT